MSCMYVTTHTHTKPATLASWPHLPRTNRQQPTHTHLLPHLVESKLAPQPVRKPNKKPSLFRTPTPCAGGGGAKFKARGLNGARARQWRKGQSMAQRLWGIKRIKSFNPFIPFNLLILLTLQSLRNPSGRTSHWSF